MLPRSGEEALYRAERQWPSHISCSTAFRVVETNGLREIKMGFLGEQPDVKFLTDLSL